MPHPLRQSMQIGCFFVPVSVSAPNLTKLNLVPYRRLVWVHKRFAFVTAGALATLAGQKILLGSHHVTKSYRVFCAVEVTDELEWIATTEAIHPVTKMPTGRTEAAPVLIPVSHHRAEVSEKDSGANVARDYLITNQAVTTEDTLGGKRVQEVTENVGLYLVEVAQ